MLGMEAPSGPVAHHMVARVVALLTALALRVAPMALRVALPTALALKVAPPTAPALREAADGRLDGILGYSELTLVSSDFNHDPHSSVFAAPQTTVIDGKLVRILTWYDNEWGFSNRMADTAVYMGNL